MKKIIALILALTLCLGLLAGCNNDKKPDGKSDLDAAANYLKLMYRDSAEKTPSSYTVVNQVRVGETIFDVEWAVEIKSGDKEAVSLNAANTECTVAIKEDTREDTAYTLTGTIKGADGKTATVSFDHLVPKVPTTEEVINAAYALEPGEAMDSASKLTGTVTKIDTPYDDGYKNVTVTIVCEGFEDKPIMCYRMKGEGADKVAVGDLITVTGTIKNYNGTIEFDAGCALVKLEAGAGKLPEGGDKTDYSKMSPAEIVDAAYALEGGKSFDSEVSLTGVVSAVDTPFDANYNNVTVTIIVEGKTDKPIKCFRMKGEGADQVTVGDTITVTGIIKNYVHSSGDSEIEFDAGCALTARTAGNGGSAEPKPTDPPATNPPAPPATTTDYASSITAGKAYKLALVQGNLENKTLYFAGTSRDNQPWYMNTTENAAEGVDVYVEEVDGGFRLYFTKDGAKSYLDMYKNDTHYNLRITNEPTAVYTWNAEHCTVVASVEGTDCYIGTYNTYNTMSCSRLDKISGSFPAHFYPVG